jgi:topoisomerase-4 subunit A
MESLFRLSELEVRIPLNMNVLDASQSPRVMNLKEVLQAFLDHRRDVLLRRSQFRLGKIAARLEILAAMLIAFLNLDEVIRIIRSEDEPKPRLISRFKLTDNQAEAILNTRLRQLRKLEEMEIRGEDRALREEQKELTELVADEKKQWRGVAEGLKKTREIFGPKTAWGARRSVLKDAPAVAEISAEAFVTREPVTVVLSEKGWVRALKGHVDDTDALKFKDGDAAAFTVKCETTDKLLLFASDGRAFTLTADKLPGGRGAGEPIRLMIELGENDAPVALFKYEEGAKRLIAGAQGYGFVIGEDDMLASKRGGKQVLTVDSKERALVAAPVSGDMVAVIGQNRKLLIFPLAELPEMARGRGVKLQSYKQGGLADAVVFAKKDGLSWTDASGRVRTVPDWADWKGKRAQAGLIAPRGFSRSGKFQGD